MELTHKYLEKLGFSTETESTDFGEIFLNIITLNDELNNKISIPFIFYKDEDALFKFYLNEWNKNEINYFIAVGSDRSYIVNAKEKTKSEDIIKSSLIIDNFDYGTDTFGYNDINLEKLPYTKENIDNSYFFNYVLKKQKEVKNEVDTYLLNNLVALKEELSKFDTDNENINGLILKSLFVKYLEDREILAKKPIVKVLEEENPSALAEIFSDIAVINGDILKKDLKVTKKHINELAIFYSHDYKEYKKGQPNLFYPYKFDKIPIQLISNVYEEFLGRTNKKEKKSKGIFYTRTFVIDFMLSHSIYPKIEKQSHSTILDPACGSGAFLVQAFNKILKSQPKKNLSIDKKAEILQKQIFGVDTDINALQITAFSLYLTLLDEISKNEIQEQLKNRNPILPSLIGYNLLQKNTIIDDIKFDIKFNSKIHSFTKFDCIVANPPWYIVNNTLVDKEIKTVHKEKKIYKSIHKRYLQLSQFFLCKIYELSHNDTEISIITNSSNFYSSFSNQFREEILSKYRLKKFFELSKLKSILFKKAGEPASVLILDTKTNENNIINYIVPNLTPFSKKLRIITYSSTDIKKVKQIELRKEDILWKIFLNGNWKDYQLIKKQIINKDDNIKISCEQGIQGQVKHSFIIKEQSINILKKIKSSDSYYIHDIEKLFNKYFHNHTELKNKIESISNKHNIKIDNKTFLQIKKSCKKQKIETPQKDIRKYFDKDDFQRFSFGLDENFINSIQKDINWNNNIKRKRSNELFYGERILVLRQPQKENDYLKLKTLYTNQHFIFPDKMMGIRILPIQNSKLFFGILNSKFAGYYLINTSSQWYKGRRDTLLNEDFVNFPIPKRYDNNIKDQIICRIDTIEQYRKTNKSIIHIEKELDELVFDLYGLLEFEKEIIREFYQINVERKNDAVEVQDLQNYIEAFRNTYQLMIKENLRLNASFIISKNIGAVVKFNIVDKSDFIKEIKQGNFTQRQVLNLVKEHQIQKELLNGHINEEKVKIYDKKSFYIIKSNQFKDWTKRQAIEDANEEVKEMLKKML